MGTCHWEASKWCRVMIGLHSLVHPMTSVTKDALYACLDQVSKIEMVETLISASLTRKDQGLSYRGLSRS